MSDIKKFLLTSIFMALCFSSFAQNFVNTDSLVAKGIVYDVSTKQPIEGVSITIPGFGAAISDSAGTFTIKVPSYKVTLQVSAMDYQIKEVPLRGSNRLEIYLYEEGYKSFNQNANTYYKNMPLMYETQSTVSLDARNNSWKLPSTSPEMFFKGEVAGLNVISRSGTLGIGSNMFLRGFSSLYASNQPLIIVDGMIFDNNASNSTIVSGYFNNPLSDIELNDIENVTIIKDAASIYGAKASNGIIFIRTNHAYKTATRIDFSLYGGLNEEPGHLLPLLQTGDYRSYLTEMLQSKGLSSDSIQSLPYMIDSNENADYYRYHNNTDWRSKIFQSRYNQGVNLKIAGGDDIALYSLSLGYSKYAGALTNTDFSRYSVRFNSDINISKKFSANANLSFTYNQHHLMDDGVDPAINPIYASHIKSPFMAPKVIDQFGDISPNLEDADILGVSNPVALINNYQAVSNNSRIFGSFNFNYKINKNLVASDIIGINFNKLRDNLFVPHLGVVKDTVTQGVIENTMAQNVSQLFAFYNDLRLAYTGTLNMSHNFSGLLGARTGISQGQGDFAIGHNSANDQMRSVGTGVTSLREVGGSFHDNKWLTFYANVDYNYQKRYFLSFNLALDGSSRFGTEAKGISFLSGKFGFFPSVAGAWLLSSESFFPKTDIVSLFKVRASYGITGNDDIGDYASKKYYVEQRFLNTQGIVKGVLWNPELKWETAKKMNGGIDVALFRERVSVSFDVFQNKTEDMLNVMQAQRLTGFDTYVVNDGSFKTNGYEVSLNGRILNGKLKWDVGANLAHYKTKITAFPEEKRMTAIMGGEVLTQVGQPLGVFYGYKTNGVFATQQEAENSGLRALMPNTALIPFSAGDVRFEDYHTDGIIDDNDKQIIGDPNPDFTGMFSNRFEWKGLALEACFIFSYGNDVYNYFRYELESMQTTNNQSLAVLNRWQTDGQVTDIPKATWGDPIGNSRFSDRWIEDGSFLRLKYITLSYKVPLKVQFVKNLEFFVSGQNLWTLTSYLGMDPEFSMDGAALKQGIDIGMTPQVKSVFVGIKIGL